jgi:hypothetical protein
MLKVEVVDNFDKFNSLEPIWNKLLSQTDADNVFMTFEWFTCWWKAYGEDKKMCFILVKENYEIIGIAPLMKYKMKIRGFPVKTVGFIANEQTNRAGFIISRNKKAVVESIINYLEKFMKKYCVYNFEFIPECSDTSIILNEVLNEKGLRYIRRPVIQSPYLSCASSWDEYFKSRTRRFKKKINYLNNLLKDCNPQIVVYRNTGLDKGLEEMVSISKKTWKYRSNSAIASNFRNRAFYELLAKTAANKGWLDFSVLKLNDAPVAFELNLVYKETFYAIKTGFDTRYSRFSPSNFLAYSVIKKCFNEGFKEYDLLGNNEQYKMEWTSVFRKHYQYLIFNKNFISKAALFVETKIVPFLKKCTLKK